MSKLMKCDACGAMIGDNVNLCPKCGYIYRTGFQRFMSFIFHALLFIIFWTCITCYIVFHAMYSDNDQKKSNIVEKNLYSINYYER